jgi:hypothetical protein
LTDEVYALWGPPGRQAPPLGTYQKIEKTEEKVVEQTSAGNSTKTVVHETKVEIPIAVDSSSVHVKLALEQQRKGLMWFPTYGVDFNAQYTFLNDNTGAHDVTVHFPLRSPEDGRSTGSDKNGSFDGFAIVDAQGAPVEFQIAGDDAVFSQHFEVGERHAYGISYRTRGTTSFRYVMAQGSGHVHDLTVSVDTDFNGVNFPIDTLSPTSRALTPDSFHGEWHFASLVSTSAIGIELPQLLNPGPLATKVTLFAPVSLLFFFFVVAVLSQVRGHGAAPGALLLVQLRVLRFPPALCIHGRPLVYPHLLRDSVCGFGVSGGELRASVRWVGSSRCARWASPKCCIWCCFPTPSSGKASPAWRSRLAPLPRCSS